mgnify:CR=1 FL=1
MHQSREIITNIHLLAPTDVTSMEVNEIIFALAYPG